MFHFCLKIDIGLQVASACLHIEYEKLTILLQHSSMLKRLDLNICELTLHCYAGTDKFIAEPGRSGRDLLFVMVCS